MTRPRPAVRVVLTGLMAAALASVPGSAVAVPGSLTVTQPTPLYVGDNDHEGSSTFQTVSFTAGGGQASVFPTVEENPHLARIVDVNVVVGGFTHENPDDVQLVLVQQGGPQVTLMANAGGSTDVNNLFLVFDDEAADPLPDEAAMTNGDYRPAAYGSVSQLPSPAPPVVGNTSLSAFDGLPVGTTWQLFAFDDDGTAATGQFTFWRVEFVYATTAYPSELTVAGAGTVQDVDVTLHGFTSTYPADLDLLLVGPTGAQVTLLSDAGGSEDPDNIELTLDDEAAVDVPTTFVDPLLSGHYRPTNLDDGPGDDVYPPPAPAPTGATALSVFDGTDPNGTWRLFAVDNVDGDVTGFAGGWSLDIAYDDSAPPTGTVAIAGADTTATSAVTLDLAATDPTPGTGVKEMRFSNDGTTYSAFQPYAASAAWTLTAGDGTKTVYAQFRDGAGNVSPTVSDTVVLDTVPPDTTSPTATKVKPRKNAQDVGPKAKVRVVASEALDPDSITRRSVVLKRNGVRVKGKVTYVAARHTIVLKPRKELKPGTYKVIVKTTVTDLAGNGFDGKKKPGLQKLTWTFEVG